MKNPTFLQKPIKITTKIENRGSKIDPFLAKNDPFLTHFGSFLGLKITFFQTLFVVLSLLNCKNHVFFRDFFGIFLKKVAKIGQKKGHF